MRFELSTCRAGIGAVLPAALLTAVLWMPAHGVSQGGGGPPVLQCLCEGFVTGSVTPMPCVGLAGYSFEMGDGHCSQPPTCPNPPATCDWEAMLFGREKDDCGGAFTYHVNGQLVFSQDDSIVVNTRGHLNCGQSILLELKYGGAPFVALTFICDSCSL